MDPSKIPTGHVYGRYHFVNEDSLDTDKFPQATPVVGSVVFMCTAKPPIQYTGPDGVEGLIPGTFTATFDSEGYLTSGGQRGIDLPANDSDLFNPSGFTWVAKFNIKHAAGASISIPDVPINVLTGQRHNLPALAAISASGGVVTTRGPAGPEGQPGADGIDGTDGADGQDGPSAYQVAVANGFAGTQTQWLESLKGAPGKDGTNGKDGAQGTPGTNGVDGESAYEIAVLNGFVGTEPLWLESLKGADGQDGEQGEQGVPGDRGPAGPSAIMGWEKRLSEFPGATDDDKLSAFMAYGAAQTHRGITVVLDEVRDYTFERQQTLYNGFSIKGTNRPQDQARSSNPLGNRIQLRTNGGWFALTQAQTFGCAIQGLSINATSTARVVEGHPSNVLWTTVFRDIAYQNGPGVLGSSTQKLLLTACAFDGFWNVNNVRDAAFCIGGSDCKFAFTELLLDSPEAFRNQSTYLLNLNSLSKTNWRNIYMTCESFAGILNAGGMRQTFTDSIFEGRNATRENTWGSILRNSGTLSFRDCWFAYAMVNPSLITNRTDRGVLHQTGGYMLLDGCSYERANGVAESVPFLFASGGKVRIRNMHASGSWSGKPVVQQTTAGIIDADDSVTVVTAA